MKLNAQAALDYAWGDIDPEIHACTIELNELIETDRWSSIHRLILKDPGGRLWMTTYSQGLTEYQDEQPFGNADEAEFAEVEKVAVQAWEYRQVTAAPSVQEATAQNAGASSTGQE